MDYGMSFKEACAAMENDLAAFDDMQTAMEALDMTLTEQDRKSSATDKNNETLRSPAQVTQDLMKQIQDSQKKTEETLNRVHKQCLKLLQNTWTSNESFISQYNSMANQYQLSENITVINWTYGHKAEQYLHSKIAKFRALINTNIGYLNRWQNIPSNAVIPKSGKVLDKACITEMGAPSSINTPDEFMGHIRSQFRGRKSEKTYRGDMAQTFIQEVRSFAKTKTTYQQDMEAADRALKQLQNIARGQLANSANVDDNEKRGFVKLVKNAHHMIVLYANMIYFMYRLHVEYILNRRLLINRLYTKSESDSEKKERQNRQEQRKRQSGQGTVGDNA